MQSLFVPAFALLFASTIPVFTENTALAENAPAAPAAGPSGNAQQVANTVSSVQAFYDKSTTFSARFQQTFFVKAYNKTKVSGGTVIFSKPGKMNWIYDTPKGNKVVSNGSKIWIFENQTPPQCFEQTIDKSQYPAALSFLTGTGRLADTFNFTLYPGAQLGFPGGNVLMGIPKTPTPAYTKVLFYVDAQTSQVRRVMILDHQGNRNRFDFSEPRVNEPVNESQFTFSPPAGLTCIKP